VRLAKLIYSRQVSSWCCVPKIIKVRQCFMELFKK